MKRTLKKLFKKDKLNVMLVFVFIIGLSVMLYPPISSYWNSKVQSRAVASYSNAVKSLTEEEKRHNVKKKLIPTMKKLKDVNRPFLNYAEAGDYNSILDISGTGIMGYVTIEKLGVELPIYHGTSEGVLQVAAGHLEAVVCRLEEKAHIVFFLHTEDFRLQDFLRIWIKWKQEIPLPLPYWIVN